MTPYNQSEYLPKFAKKSEKIYNYVYQVPLPAQMSKQAKKCKFLKFWPENPPKISKNLEKYVIMVLGSVHAQKSQNRPKNVNF